MAERSKANDCKSFGFNLHKFESYYSQKISNKSTYSSTVEYKSMNLGIEIQFLLCTMVYSVIVARWAHTLVVSVQIWLNLN